MAPESDRLALVTGTTRGIGEAVAAGLVENGWTVIGVARGAARLQHARYQHLMLDLGDPQALASAIESQVGPVVSAAEWRRVGLVNNAAASGVLGPVETIDPAGLLRLSAINWVSPTWLVGFMLRRARADVALRVVNVSSGAAVHAFPGLVDYCGSKAALRMTSMVTAAELESPLRTTPAPVDTAVLSYEPGTVDTEMQLAARSRPLDLYPWGGVFRDFAARGALVPPAAPAAEIIGFLETDHQPRFSERRLGR